MFDVRFRGRPGPDVTEGKSIRRLSRAVHWSSSGSEHEADQRYAETVAQQFGLGSLLKPVETPSAQVASVSEGSLRASNAAVYRTLAAYANCLFQDRADMGFAAKELCRHMLCSRQCD